MPLYHIVITLIFLGMALLLFNRISGLRSPLMLAVNLVTALVVSIWLLYVLLS